MRSVGKRHGVRMMACAGVLVSLAGITGCGGSSTPSSEPSLTLGPSSSAPDAPTSKAPSAPAIPTSYPRSGLVFSSLPKPKADVEPALEAYAKFEEALRHSFRTAKLDPGVRKYADSGLADQFASGIDYQQSHDITYGGTTRIAVEVAGSSAHTVVLDLCVDSSHARLITAGKATRFDPARSAVRVTMNAQAGPWTVGGYADRKTTC